MAGEADVAALEESRRAALAAGDIEALSDLVADDYVHVHATALIHDKAAMLAHVRKSPRTVAAARAENSRLWRLRDPDRRDGQHCPG